MSGGRARTLSAFAGYGIALEEMIVDRASLDVRGYADRILVDGTERPVSDVVRGNIGWSNELMLHVLELKNVEPVATLAGLDAAFHAEVGVINAKLVPQWLPPLQSIVRRGTLAERISSALGGDTGRLPAVHREMCAYLRDNRMFAVGASVVASQLICQRLG